MTLNIDAVIKVIMNAVAIKGQRRIPKHHHRVRINLPSHSILGNAGGFAGGGNWGDLLSVDNILLFLKDKRVIMPIMMINRNKTQIATSAGFENNIPNSGLFR